MRGGRGARDGQLCRRGRVRTEVAWDGAAVTRPGGLVVLTTLSRTTMSFLKAIVGAEYVLVTHENNLLFDPQIVAYRATSPTGGPPRTTPR